MAPALLSPIHPSPSSHNELKHESGPALLCLKFPKAPQSSQDKIYTPTPGLPHSHLVTFSPTPTPHSLRYRCMDPLGDSPVRDCPHNNLWHSGHPISMSACPTWLLAARGPAEWAPRTPAGRMHDTCDGAFSSGSGRAAVPCLTGPESICEGSVERPAGAGSAALQGA